MAQATSLSTTSRYRNLSNEALADAMAKVTPFSKAQKLNAKH
jgi:hypothetical protein